jgi:hypothetical protein
VTTGDEHTDAVAWLASDEASPALEAARACLAAAPGDPLAAGSRLRVRIPDLPPDRAAAVLEQATLAQVARDRYGLTADLLLTRDGLEQATRPEVAARRARLVAASGARRVVDLTGGLGFDTAAFLDAGLAVTALERDPATALMLARNCPTVRVLTADATAPGVLADLLRDLAPTDVVFVDPARRDPLGPRERATGRARPERDPARWSPPWSFVESIPHPRVAAKAAPGITVPPGWQAEWVSVDRTIVECALYSWPTGQAARRAVILQHGVVTVLDGSPDPLPTASALGSWLHEPDASVLRAGALGALGARDAGLASVGPPSTWLTSEHPSTSPALRSHLVLAELTGTARQRRRTLADLGVTRATVKSRDVDVEPRRVLRELGLAEGPERVIVMTRRGDRPVSYLVEPAAARSG